MAASRLVRTTRPRPVAFRSCRAATTPYAPYMPASRSPIGHADPVGCVGVGAGQRHQPGLALRDLVVARAAALGAVVAEPADRQDDQARVELVQPLDREPEPVQHAGAEVLQQDVGVGDHAGQDAAAVVALEVQRDGLLVAVAGQEVRRDRVVLRADERRPPAAGVVAGAGGLDLDDAGAEVAQHHPGVRPGEGAGQVDDGDAVQGAAHVVLRSVVVSASRSTCAQLVGVRPSRSVSSSDRPTRPAAS